MTNHICLTCEHRRPQKPTDYAAGHPAYAGRCEYIIGAKLPIWAAPIVDRMDDELNIWTDAPRTVCETWLAATTEAAA